jgi:hypothetical protein
VAETKDFVLRVSTHWGKRWHKCIDVGGGYVEKYFFSQVQISHLLRFISICDLFSYHSIRYRKIGSNLDSNKRRTELSALWRCT